MTILGSPTVGIEQLQRALFFTIFDKLNNALSQVEAFMAISDQEVAERTQRQFFPTALEHVTPENFYEGHRPSLIKAPIERYPNVSVIGTRAAPSPDNAALDQMTSYTHSLVVEAMVKSEVSEEEVSRRVNRTLEAINLCVFGDQSLQGTVTGLDNAPTLMISDVFTRKERTSYGPHWFWQGARISYAVRKESVVTTAPAGSFFRNGLAIDQA